MYWVSQRPPSMRLLYPATFEKKWGSPLTSSKEKSRRRGRRSRKGVKLLREQLALRNCPRIKKWMETFKVMEGFKFFRVKHILGWLEYYGCCITRQGWVHQLHPSGQERKRGRVTFDSSQWSIFEGKSCFSRSS